MGKRSYLLFPKSDTYTYGRSGFSIHGSDTPDSSGCIDLTSDFDFFIEEFQNKKNMLLTIGYKN